MTHLEQIESAIRALSPKDLDKLQRWFEEFYARQWDDRIASDIEAGRLESFAQQARESHNNGESREL